MHRNPIFDNAKFFMIFLVVFGHFIEPFIKMHDLLKVIWMFIYIFHMPVFIFLSGLTFKNTNNKFNFKKDIESLLIPFIVFTFLFESYNYINFGSISSYTKGLMPFWILWFLPSLAIWRASTCYFVNFRHPIIISFFISLIAGYSKEIGYFLGLSRTIYFFPFFLIGFYSKELWSTFEKFRTGKELYFFLILIFIATSTYLMREQPHQWLWGSFAYQKLSAYGINAALIRTVIYIISITCVFSILSMIPNKKNRISNWGQNSLYVYLWHGFFIKQFISLGGVSFLKQLDPLIILFLMLIFSISITLILSSQVVKNLTDKIILKPIKRIALS